MSSLNVCLFGYLFVCLSVCMTVCLYDCLFVWLSVCLSVCLYDCLFVCLSVCMPVWMFVCLSVYLYIYLYVCISICIFILHSHFYQSMCLFIQLSIYLFIHPSPTYLGDSPSSCLSTTSFSVISSSTRTTGIAVSSVSSMCTFLTRTICNFGHDYSCNLIYDQVTI